MAITHTNRKGEVYYLHRGETKAGKPRYYFSRKKDGELADAVPEGYEVHEKPNAQVFLRKVVPTKVTPEEVALVKEGIRKYAGLSHFIVEAEKDSIVVHLPDQSRADAERLVASSATFPTSRMVEWVQQQSTYSAVMRFVLRDPDTRRYA